MQPLDSCDASGEYTTEESDIERHSVLSDTHLESEPTNGLIDDLKLVDHDKTPMNEKKQIINSITETVTPKVIMRSKRKNNGPRPWSISCLSHFGNKTDLNDKNDPISQFSISETALHQLVPTTSMKSRCSDVT